MTREKPAPREGRKDFQRDETGFIDWAKAHSVPLATVLPGPDWDDLAPLGQMIGDATVVALGEGIHCAAEPLQFRNRLLQYLVQEKGFTAIAIESGIVESRVVHDYVLGGCGDLATVVSRGIGWTFDRLPQNRALVRWLRDYNADPRHARKVNFYGFDVPGSPANVLANRGHDTALSEVLEYLSSVDSEASNAFRARLGSVERSMRFGIRRRGDVGDYDLLTQSERDALTSAVTDLVTLLERREASYARASSPHHYAWAYRSAVGARQMDSWLRQLPQPWEPVIGSDKYSSKQVGFICRSGEVRDRAQADNLDWILQQEGPTGKILIFAHRVHLSSMPVHWLWNGEEHSMEVAGTYLRRRLGDRLLTIGNLIGQGEVSCLNFRKTLERASPESIDGIASKVGEPLFLLDTRQAPATVREWLSAEYCLAHGTHEFQVAIGRAFDVLFYVDTLTPACGASAPASTDA